MVFVGPFQLRRFCDSENKCEDVFSKKHLQSPSQGTTVGMVLYSFVSKELQNKSYQQTVFKIYMKEKIGINK